MVQKDKCLMDSIQHVISSDDGSVCYHQMMVEYVLSSDDGRVSAIIR